MIYSTFQGWGATASFTLTSSSPTTTVGEITISGGKTSKDGYQVNSTTLTISASTGYTISNVSLTFTGTSANRVGGSPTVSPDTHYQYSISSTTGTISLKAGGTAQQSVTFTTTDKCRISAMTVTYSAVVTDSYDIHIGKNNADYTDQSLTNTSGTTWSKTVTLDGSSYYEFKVKKTPAAGDAVWYGNAGKITATTSPAWDFSSGVGSNCKLYTTVSGSYTFSWNTSTSKLTVTYPTGSHPTKRIYMACGSTSWCNDSPKFFVHSWGVTDYNTQVQLNACGDYYADIIWYNDYFQFTRNSSSATAYDNNQWNVSQDLTYDSEKLLWTCTGWSDGKGTFSKSAYSPVTYTISYSKGSTTYTGGNAITGSKDSESKTCGTDFTLPSSAVFTATGYTQTGWATSDGGSKAYNLGGTYTTNAAQTFYPVWTVQNYNLTWNLGGGTTTSAGTGIASGVSVNTTSSVAYGTSLTAPTVTKDYHTFSAWSPAVASTMPAEATTYTATWTANKYNVSTSLTNMSVSSGTTGTNAATYGINYSLTLAATGDYVLPTTITVTIGGSAAPSGSYSYNYSTGVVTITGSYITGNIVITAAGEENVFRVTYTANGGSGSVPTDATAYDPDDEVTVLGKNTLSKTGYTFTGWSDGTTFYEEGNKFNITSSKTLAAVWEPTNSCTTTLADINFKSSSWSGKTFSQGNTSTSDQINGLYFYSKNDTKQFSLSSNTSNGLTFPNNNMSSGNYYFCIPLQSGEINGKITVTIKHGYSSNSATYNYYFWDGATSYTHGSTNGSSGVQVTDANKSDTQITFEVTTSNANHKGYLYIGRKSSSYTQIYGVTVTTPCPTSTSKTVTFNKGSNPAPTSPSNIPAQKIVPYNHKILRPATDPSASNFIFNGWVTTSGGSTSFDFANTAITANTTIYAKWTAKTAPTTSYTFTLSATCTSASPTATLSGSQSGWSYQLYKDGVASGDPKAGTGSALTWTSLGAGTYLVKTVETPSQASAQIGESATVYASTSITSNLASSRSVNANVSTTVSITATGASPTYQWYTCNSDGTGKVAIDGKTTNTFSYTFTNADAPTKYICCVVTGTCGTITSNIQTVTITPTYLLTYDANGGSGAPAAAYRPATTAALSSTVPTRSNYAFEGWNTKSNGSGTRYAAGASFLMPAQATTLYAEWVETVTLTWNVQVNVEETTITTTSTSSSYTARVAAPSNLALNGVTVTSDKKGDATNKISTTKAKGGYISATFVVASGYKFTPTSMVLKTTAITEAKTIEVNVGSNSQTWSQPKSSSSVPTEHTYTFAAASAITGTGTMKIYAYGGEDGTKGYRIGTPITLYGKVEPVTLTYVGGSGSNWNTTANWSPACIPTIDHDVVIEVPVDVNITNARAKSVVIYNNGSTKTGQLILDAGKELVVAGTVCKTTDGSSYTATGENDIVFNSTSVAGLGALVMGSHDGTNKATVNFTTRAAGTKDDNTSIAQYVGTPFNDENNILHNWYNSWIYGIIYNGGNIDWVRINEGQGMTPFRGYCVFSADGANHVYWEQGTLNASTTQTISGLNWQSGAGTDNLNNENLLANSWMAPIYIKAMQSTDFVNADATVYIFNSTSASAYESGGFEGNYSSYTVNTADAVIPAMQSFSVFTTGSGASVKLDYDKIVYQPALAGTAVPVPNKVISRERKSDDEANKLRIFVRTESGLGDILYMWEREDFSEAFENGWDGRKMYGESYAPQLYAITPGGAMAVNCVPTYEGVLIGFRAGTDEQTYTFSFEYDADAEPLYLYDKYADAYTRVLSGNTYLFVANDYDAHARFSLTHYMPGVATGIEASATGDQNPEIRCQKILLNERILILRDGKLYDVTGKTVK